MRRCLCVLVGMLAACGPTAPFDGADSAGRVEQAIIGGTLSLDDTQVFALGDGTRSFCTATLISERTLLTAAHCLAQDTIFASNQADVKGWPADSIPVVDKRIHPKWQGGDPAWDVGLLLLESSPGVKPKGWNRVPLSMIRVPEVRAIGFGETHTNGSGVRTEAMVRVTSLSANILHIGSAGGASTCFGDSGGPSMHIDTGEGADGVERVVGVHVFSNTTACNGGGDVRVDAIADFIDQWTRDKAATCATDGACVPGCAEVDLDCYCTTDGACDARCPLPDTDKDCPRNCLRDGMCAFGTCGIKDPDCKDDGAACENADSCTGHQCLTDALHGDPYCSRTCSTSSECTPDMHCRFGVCRYPVLPLATMGEACRIGEVHCSGGICAGQSDDTAVCRVGCDATGSCPGSMKCVTGARGVRYCQGTAVLEVLPTERPAAGKRCSVGGGELFLGGLALLLLRARRSKQHPVSG